MVTLLKSLAPRSGFRARRPASTTRCSAQLVSRGVRLTTSHGQAVGMSDYVMAGVLDHFQRGPERRRGPGGPRLAPHHPHPRTAGHPLADRRFRRRGPGRGRPRQGVRGPRHRRSAQTGRRSPCRPHRVARPHRRIPAVRRRRGAGLPPDPRDASFGECRVLRGDEGRRRAGERGTRRPRRRVRPADRPRRRQAGARRARRVRDGAAAGRQPVLGPSPRQPHRPLLGGRQWPGRSQQRPVPG